MFFKIIPTLVEVGGYGDGEFRSVAAGIIDAYPNVEDRVLKKIFEHYYLYYPQNIPPKESGTLTVAERMRFLHNDYRKSMAQLVINLAYVLRQIAVDELVAQPYKYMGAFINASTSVEAMRQSGTYIDESAIAALASALHVKIELAFVESNKEIPLHLTYNKEAKTTVNMQLMDNHYRPKVHNPQLFQSVNKPIIHLIEPKHVEHLDRPMSEIIKDIELGVARDQLAYQEMQGTLNNLVADELLSKKDLLTLYVKNMPSSDNSRGRVTNLALDNNQRFTIALSQPQNLGKTNYDEQVMAELIHALSIAHTIGDLNLDHLPQVMGLKNG
jgi:hypothetical protein